MPFLGVIFHYFLIAAILFIAMLLYFRIADKFNIIDKPNERSSHTAVTIRGGGVVFWLAALLYLLTCDADNWAFFVGITLIAAVSFWDDISSLSNKLRIVIHFVAISLVFYNLELYQNLPWWQLLMAYVFFVGTLNAYNFMDGINGITGLYSLVVLAGLQYVNWEVIAFVNPDLITYPMLTCLVFLYFNARKRAKCFAGDVGSMTIALWIVTLLLILMVTTGSVLWILFLLVYGVDTVCTILHRLYLRQNIFKAHRLHFYQVLANERKMAHVKVSATYALLQALICALTVYVYITGVMSDVLILLLVGFPLILIYLLKFRRYKKHNT
ncbi:MAG: glycosyltransferase family 4 protein [Prevotellaceae bacterium]|jgi:UDP-N-acetylmuramyl pentapeptide phosphotransferase/UDP-N-acetylglucosamine-1-phosphate transferase|nr:glycosyltransferase family 4 protein [Prevotellaceae bacterium]